MQSRRSFIRLSIGSAVPVLLSACAAPPTPAAPAAAPPAKPTSPAVTAPQPTTAKPAAASKDPYPTYVPFTGGSKPDYHDTNVLFADGFDNYPAHPFKANQSPPRTGGV